MRHRARAPDASRATATPDRQALGKVEEQDRPRPFARRLRRRVRTRARTWRAPTGSAGTQFAYRHPAGGRNR